MSKEKNVPALVPASMSQMVGSASVTLPLNEIDNLRAALAKANADNVELRSNEKKVLLTVTRLDKIQTTEIIGYDNWGVPMYKAEAKDSHIIERKEFVNLDDIEISLKNDDKKKEVDLERESDNIRMKHKGQYDNKLS